MSVASPRSRRGVVPAAAQWLANADRRAALRAQLLTAPKAVPAKTRPAAALEWQAARLPLLGRLWATAWLPSVLLAGCVVALMYLLQTSGVATAGYDIQRLQAEREDWSLRNDQLQLELAKRRSLTWIEAEAVGRLGMVRAEPTALTYLTLNKGR